MNFLHAGMHYTAVAECETPAPGAFANDWGNFAEPQHQGIYVMWTLPKALRRRPSESSDFPFVPNRWLVVRLLTPETTPDGPPEVTAWVVESDGIDAVNGASAYVDPTVTSTLTPTMIGLRRQITPASPWQEPSTTPPYFLRAVAEANPAFAASQPFNENVFSVFDDLQNQGVPASTVSYYVVGWYSDPAADILAADDDPAELATTLGTLGWSAEHVRRTDDRHIALSGRGLRRAVDSRRTTAPVAQGRRQPAGCRRLDERGRRRRLRPRRLLQR